MDNSTADTPRQLVENWETGIIVPDFIGTHEVKWLSIVLDVKSIIYASVSLTIATCAASIVCRRK